MDRVRGGPNSALRLDHSFHPTAIPSLSFDWSLCRICSPLKNVNPLIPTSHTTASVQTGISTTTTPCRTLYD
jgi:hypothetical protein